MPTGHCRRDCIARADGGRSGANRARWMSAARAEQRGQKSGQAARAQVRNSWPLRSLERLRGARAQTGLPAFDRPLRARSRSDSPPSLSARSGATVCGVRAGALAPNPGANYLLKFHSTATGQGGRHRLRRCAHTPPHLPSRARSGPTRTPGRSRTLAPPSAHLPPSPRPPGGLQAVAQLEGGATPPPTPKPGDSIDGGGGDDGGGGGGHKRRLRSAAASEAVPAAAAA